MLTKTNSPDTNAKLALMIVVILVLTIITMLGLSFSKNTHISAKDIEIKADGIAVLKKETPTIALPDKQNQEFNEAYAKYIELTNDANLIMDSSFKSVCSQLEKNFLNYKIQLSKDKRNQWELIALTQEEIDQRDKANNKANNIVQPQAEK